MAKQLHGLETGTAKMAEIIKLHGHKQAQPKWQSNYMAMLRHSQNG